MILLLPQWTDWGMQTRCLNFAIRKAESGYRVRFSQNGESPLEEMFQTDLREAGRLTGIVANIENDTCTRDDLRELGAEMWAGLNAGIIGRAVADTLREPDSFFHICLQLPPELERLPWETLYDMKRASFFAAEPGYCVFRAPQVECDPIPDIGGPRDGLDLLAVVPEGSGLGIEQELSSLNRVVKLVENLRISDLRGRVTPNAIQQRLGETQPNIFHFVGHGELDSTGGVTIRLNSEEGGQEEFWAQAEQFSSIFAKSSIRLAVLNCCYGGRSARTSLSGLGPLLLRRGVPAIVAMNYPIADSAAQSFSEFFYNALLKGENGGRVDIAIQHTRDTTFY